MRAITRNVAWNASSASWGLLQHLPADPKHHRSVPIHQGRKTGLGGLVGTREEPVEELPVGQVADHAHAVEDGKMRQGKDVDRLARHASGSLRLTSHGSARPHVPYSNFLPRATRDFALENACAKPLQPR